MSSAELLRQLEAAQKIAFRGEGLIEAQRRVVASLEVAGVSAGDARGVLEAMEETQKDQLAEIEPLTEALNQLEASHNPELPGR